MSLVTTLTHVLPHRALSSLARRLAYSQDPRTRRWLIDTVVRRFGVELLGASFLIELEGLGGRDRLPDVPLTTLWSVPD